MTHKRTDVRVPISGEVTLSDKQGVQITARARDISPGGFGLDNPSTPLEQIEYQVTICTERDTTIQLTAILIHKSIENTGFKTSDIDAKNLEIISQLISEFQTTEEFLEQIDQHDLLQQNFIDEDGNEILVSFDFNSDK